MHRENKRKSFPIKFILKKYESFNDIPMKETQLHYGWLKTWKRLGICLLSPLKMVNGYTLSKLLRDVNCVLSLAAEENQHIVKSVLLNKIQGNALQNRKAMENPTWEQIQVKLKIEFGLKESYFNLRINVLTVSANNITLR